MKKTLAILLIAMSIIAVACGKDTPTPTMAPELPDPTAVPTIAEALPTATLPPKGTTSQPTDTAVPPTATPTLPPLAQIPAFEGMTLLYHVSGGIGGLCQDVAVFQDGQSLYGPCGGLQKSELSEGQLDRLAAWADSYAAFNFRLDDNPGGPDNMTTSLVFVGQGQRVASESEQQDIVDWVRAAYAELAGRAMPPAAVSEEVKRTALILEPQPGAVLGTPLKVRGEGINYGAELTVRVQNEQGDIIGQTLAQVDAETGKQGPFTAEVVFTETPKDQVGRVIVLAKDPAGEALIALTSVEVTIKGKGGEQDSVPAPRLRTFRGPGIELPYLSDTVVERASENQWKLLGRSVTVRPGAAEWTWTGPAYALNITTHANSDGARSVDWVPAYLRGEWEKARASSAPFSGPVNEQGELIEDKALPVRLGDKAAVQTDWFGGDSTRRVVYLSLPDRAVSFMYDIYPVENYPLAEAAADIYGLMLAQVSALSAEGSPNTVPLVEGVTEFIGPGFSILVPANASVQEIEENHWQISGPELDVRPAGEDWAWEGPAYQLDLVLEDNPDELTAAAWAEASLIASWQEAKDGEVPFTGPVNADGELVHSEIAEMQVGDVTGLRADWLAGDSIHRTIYVNAASQVLVAHYNIFDATSHPVAPIANAAHALLVASLRTGAQ